MARKLESMKPQMDEAVAWIEAVTGDKMEGTFDEWLRSGVVLCKLVNCIAPGSIKRVNKGSMPFMQMENISQFIRVAKNMGLNDCFDTVDLYKGQDIGNVVTSIHAFGSVVQKIKSYKGPQLGVKLADANKREFTEEQLREARSAQSKLTLGSSGHMERSTVTKQGITFGNDSVGTGSNELTKTIIGSSNVMERSEVTKQGITFGNDAGGSGSGQATSKLTAGSANVMQRQESSRPGITFGHDSTAA